MNESKFRSLGEWFSREEMVWRGRKCKWRKWVNSDNGGRKKSEEEGLKLKDEDKGDEVKKTQQLKFDWVNSVHSQKKKKIWEIFLFCSFLKERKIKRDEWKKKFQRFSKTDDINFKKNSILEAKK